MPAVLARAAASPLVGRDVGAARRPGGVRADPPGRHRAPARGRRAGDRQDAARGGARDRAARAGASVLAGRVAEDALVPYQAWVEALAGYRAAVPPEAAAALTARDEAALARILPGIPAPPAPAEDRFRLLEAVAGLLSAVSHERPTVVVLDDLHWAEQASLVLLRHVLRWPGPMRLLLVATYRESELGRAHPLSAALADLRRDTAVDRVRLAGLDAHSTAALAPDAPAALALAVHRRTGGNPFFARELFRNAAESGADGLPEGVREVIGHRLDRLGPDAGEVLAAAAVIGPRFGVDDVDEVIRRDPLPALERALSRRAGARGPRRDAGVRPRAGAGDAAGGAVDGAPRPAPPAGRRGAGGARRGRVGDRPAPVRGSGRAAAAPRRRPRWWRPATRRWRRSRTRRRRPTSGARSRSTRRSGRGCCSGSATRCCGRGRRSAGARSSWRPRAWRARPASTTCWHGLRSAAPASGS